MVTNTGLSAPYCRKYLASICKKSFVPKLQFTLSRIAKYLKTMSVGVENITITLGRSIKIYKNIPCMPFKFVQL